jgi:hypothetical protein
MLDDEVIEAVRTEDFCIWCIDSIEEGMEILTGLSAGTADEDGEYPEQTIHYAVMNGLQRLSKEDEEDDEDEEGEGVDKADATAEM